MNKGIATAAIAAVIGLAVAPVAVHAAPQAQPAGTEKCFGVATTGGNSCAATTHACAGQSTVTRDPASFIYLPKGMCSLIAGGSLSPS